MSDTKQAPLPPNGTRNNTYTLSFAEAIEHVPERPELTAYRVGAASGDYTFRVWPSAGALETSLRMQGKRPSRMTDWRKWVGSNMEARIAARLADGHKLVIR